MSVFDWLEVVGVRPKWFSGSYNVTIGDSLSGTFGAGHTHIFGSDAKIVCDIEDMTLGRLEKYLPTVTGLALGVGGANTFVYGANTSATYIGPKVDIRRGEHVNKTSSDNIRARVKAEDGTETDKIDKATSIAAGALSALMCAAAAALDFASRCFYADLSSGKKHKGHKYEETVENLKIASYTVTGRLMALLKLLESKGSWADLCQGWKDDADRVKRYAMKAGDRIMISAKSAYDWLYVQAYYLKEAIKTAGKALKDKLADIGKAIAEAGGAIAGVVAAGAAIGGMAALEHAENKSQG